MASCIAARDNAPDCAATPPVLAIANAIVNIAFGVRATLHMFVLSG